MAYERRQPDQICRIGGRAFRLRQEYDEIAGAWHLIYPEFEEHPEHTDDGRPFSTAEREDCRHYKPIGPEGTDTGDCGGCGWFLRAAPFDIIGLCLCDAMRQSPREG